MDSDTEDLYYDEDEVLSDYGENSLVEEDDNDDDNSDEWTQDSADCESDSC